MKTGHFYFALTKIRPLCNGKTIMSPFSNSKMSYNLLSIFKERRIDNEKGCYRNESKR